MFRLTLGLSAVMLVACAAEPLSGGNTGPLQAAEAGAPVVDPVTRFDAGAPRMGGGGRDGGAPRVDAAARDARGPDGEAGAADAADGASEAALARFQVGMVGAWTGTATAPSTWNWTKATVEFAFDGDGHYHARCIAHDGTDPECVALYYGTDDDSPEKTYAVSAVRPDGKATGDIRVYFFPGDTTDDALNAIDLDPTGQTLSFDLMHLRDYGPIHYALVRQ